MYDLCAYYFTYRSILAHIYYIVYYYSKLHEQPLKLNKLIKSWSFKYDLVTDDWSI